MKTLIHLVVLAGSFAAGSLRCEAQGTFEFRNSTSSYIVTNWNSGRATGLKVAMYYSLNTNSPTMGEFVLNTNAVVAISSGPFAGLFNGQTRTVPNAQPGSFVMARIHAWDSNYTSWEAAGGFGLCRQYIVKGASPTFLLGPLGNGVQTGPALLTNMPSFGVGVSLASELCEPLVQVIAEPPLFRLRIDLNGSSTFSTRIRIEGSSTLASNSWLVLTNFYPGMSPVFWSDPDWTNHSPRFYRVRAGWN